MYLKDVVYCIIHGTDPIEITDPEGLQQLHEFNETINQQQVSAGQFFETKYGELVGIIAKHTQKS